MVLILRWTAFLVEMGGLSVTLILTHEGRFGAAVLFLLFDTLVILLFVLSHFLVEWILDKLCNKRSRIWWQ